MAQTRVAPRIFAEITRIPYIIRYQDPSTKAVLEGSYNPLTHELRWNCGAAVTLEQLSAVADWTVELRMLTLSGVHG